MNGELGPGALAVAAVLVLLNAGLSTVLQLGLARSLLIAAARTTVQLLLVGLLLKTVFSSQSPWLVGAVLVAMFASAAHEIASRQERRFAGGWRFGLGAGTTLVATLLVTALGVASLGPRPWFAPQVVIPLAGIVLGSAMSGVSVTLNAFSNAVAQQRAAIEAQLLLGRDRWQALAALQRSALRSGMIPVVNQMSAAGIITLPGMMTGQVLAGLPPFHAAMYQVFVLLLLAGATAAGAMATVRLAAWRVTDERDRLRLDRLEDR